MVFIKCFKNIPLQIVFVPIIFQPLPNVSFQTFAKPKNVYWVIYNVKRINSKSVHVIVLINSRVKIITGVDS